jgi:putative toxin-antitoxin system antitoxin component (TIGR02293 family)
MFRLSHHEPRSRSAGAHRSEPIFADAYHYEPLECVEAIKRGVPAEMAVQVARQMGISKERLFATLGLPRATVDRKVRERKTLSPDESSRVLGVTRLVGQVQAMVDESGDPSNFNAAEWVAQWLEAPLQALGGRRPAELMDTAEGQAIVANVIERIRSGAYS